MTTANQLPPDGLCTVESAAEHLHVHRKTVLRYIRDGRLPATKIGKAYRIRGADLATFTGAPTATTTPAGMARVTSIIDVPAVTPALARKLAGAVTNSLRGSRDQRGDVNAEVVYDAEQARLKIIVIGAVADTTSMLALIDVWLAQLTP